LGYFNFYYSILGYKFIINLILGAITGFLDAIGLAMFIPLLQNADSKGVAKKQPGGVRMLNEFFHSLGFPLTTNNILLLLVIVFVSKGLLKFLQQYYQVRLWHMFVRKIRFGLLNDLQGLTYKGFLQLDAGKIQNTFGTEVQRLFQSIKFYFMALQSGVLLSTYIIMAFLANWQFAMLVAVGAGLSNIFYTRIYRSTQKASVGVSVKGNVFSSFLIQAIHHFKYLKSTNYFSKYAKHLKVVIKEAEDLNKEMGMSLAVTNSFKEPMIIIIVTGVIFLQINYFHSGMGQILVVLLLFYRALSFLLLVQNNWQNFVQNAGSISSVSLLLNEMDDLQEQQPEKAFPGLKESLHIDHVDFHYGKNKVIDGVDINILKNNLVAFVGESGSGKTTVANIICGLLDPDSGAVRADGISLTDYNRDTFRNKIGYISQEPVIFTDSIFNNITFWEEPTEENLRKFWNVIEMASLTSVINSQPEKEHTLLGDNGFLISGGQKQRISIARELYKDVEILILDEATSALDSETERLIQDNIEKLHGNFTIVIIAHRLSTIKSADTIYLMEKGKVMAAGRFNEMIELSPKFKRMVSLQEV